MPPRQSNSNHDRCNYNNYNKSLLLTSSPPPTRVFFLVFLIIFYLHLLGVLLAANPPTAGTTIISKIINKSSAITTPSAQILNTDDDDDDYDYDDDDSQNISNRTSTTGRARQQQLDSGGGSGQGSFDFSKSRSNNNNKFSSETMIGGSGFAGGGGSGNGAFGNKNNAGSESHFSSGFGSGSSNKLPLGQPAPATGISHGGSGSGKGEIMWPARTTPNSRVTQNTPATSPRPPATATSGRFGKTTPLVVRSSSVDARLFGQKTTTDKLQSASASTTKVLDLSSMITTQKPAIITTTIKVKQPSTPPSSSGRKLLSVTDTTCRVNTRYVPAIAAGFGQRNNFKPKKANAKQSSFGGSVNAGRPSAAAAAAVTNTKPSIRSLSTTTPPYEYYDIKTDEPSTTSTTTKIPPSYPSTVRMQMLDQTQTIALVVSLSVIISAIVTFVVSYYCCPTCPGYVSS